ncbi:progesterone-induced-blocking factor 1-like [Pollicipes pollicipes]|uniref:progesterone-induced-blocking factor 1-like n=1 Tax=Pollicipes pollicipes TaxID=41117 RepID=UPI001884D40A|nr:progesterone-induced-blocking factor 1-like [Pollicipes pollicipes]
MHELQLLRVELAELTHQRQVEQREQQSRVDELEDQLAEALHQRNMLQIRQTGQLGQYEAELAALRQQLDQLVSRQKQLEEDNSRLQVTPDQVKRSLLHLNISEARYQELSKMDPQNMSLKDFTALRVHESVAPLEQLAEAHQRLRESALPRAVRDDLSARLAAAETEREDTLSRLAETGFQ